MGNMYSFLSGFMFAAIAVVMTRLPDPNALMAQAVSFLMATMLNVFVLYIGRCFMQVVPWCKNVPSYSGRKNLFNILSAISVLLGLGGSTVLLLLVFNLVYLAIAQTVVWILFSVIAYKSIFRPFCGRESAADHPEYGN